MQPMLKVTANCYLAERGQLSRVQFQYETLSSVKILKSKNKIKLVNCNLGEFGLRRSFIGNTALRQPWKQTNFGSFMRLQRHISS